MCNLNRLVGSPGGVVDAIQEARSSDVDLDLHLPSFRCARSALWRVVSKPTQALPAKWIVSVSSN